MNHDKDIEVEGIIKTLDVCIDALKAVLPLLKEHKEGKWVNKDSDYWMERAKQFYENGNCPICFCSDEEGHKDGCYTKELEDKNEV